MDKEYLTIKELADLAGVSTQSVYKSLKGRLADYVTTVNGKRMIRAAALKEVYGKTDPEEKAEEPKEESTEKQLIAILQEQLKAKDQQIAQLQDIVKAEQSFRYAAEQRIALLEARSEEPKEEPIESVKVDSEVESHSVTQETEDAGTQLDPPPTTGFFHRLKSFLGRRS